MPVGRGMMRQLLARKVREHLAARQNMDYIRQHHYK